MKWKVQSHFPSLWPSRILSATPDWNVAWKIAFSIVLHLLFIVECILCFTVGKWSLCPGCQTDTIYQHSRKSCESLRMSSLLQFTCYTRGLTNCSSAKRHESFQIHWLCMNTRSVLDACSIKQQSSRFELNIKTFLFFFYRVKLFCSQTPVYSLRYRGTYIRMKETLKPCLISSQKKKKKEQREKKVNTQELFF